jgi:hypothetical protein
MSESLSDFLIDLASDPARLASFAANPDGLLAHSRLTREERALLLAGEAEGLRTALAAAGSAGAGIKSSKKKSGGGGIKKTKGKGGGGGIKKTKGGGGGVKSSRKR